MNTAQYDMSARGAAGPGEPSHVLAHRWRVITIALVAGFFLEAVFAGAMLSGAGWTHRAHALTAALLIAGAATAGLVSVISLRRLPHGTRLGLTLLSLAALAVLQAVLGALSAKGANLTWLHVPLGVALVGLAGQAVAGARKVGR